MWWTGTPDTILKEKIISAHRLPLVELTGAYRTTRTAALRVLARASPTEFKLGPLCTEFSLFIQSPLATAPVIIYQLLFSMQEIRGKIILQIGHAPIRITD